MSLQKSKNIIKSWLSDATVYKLRELKNQFRPSKFYLQEQQDLVRRTAFYAEFINENDLCFDVGANVGNRVAPLLAIKARVVAVEPQAHCQAILRARFGKKIEVVPEGLDATDGEREFYLSDADYLSSFSKSWIDSVKADRFSTNSWNGVQKIRMTTLDKLIGVYGLPQFIKIDVEGYELEVLGGLTNAVKMISYEYTAPEQTARAIACLQRIKSINPNSECNFSVEETMKFKLAEFITADEMLRFIESVEFIQTGFGDIYVRSNNK